MSEYPRVVTGVMVLKEGKVLLGKRKGSVAAGDWGFPGGHLEYGETFEVCCNRELEEEVGVKVKNLRPLFIANVLRFSPKQYIDVIFVADWESGDPVLKEPEKCEEWRWVSLEDTKDTPGLFPELAFDAYEKGAIQYYPKVT